MSEDVRQEPDDRIHEQERREFAAGADEIPEAQFEGRECFDRTLVDPLVVSGDQEQSLRSRQLVKLL